eukprot:1033684-Rhodomonas_salina.1
MLLVQVVPSFLVSFVGFLNVPVYPLAVFGTDLQRMVLSLHKPMSRSDPEGRAITYCYNVSGTELVYGATRAHRRKCYKPGELVLPAYARAIRYLVLTYRTAWYNPTHVLCDICF